MPLIRYYRKSHHLYYYTYDEYSKSSLAAGVDRVNKVKMYYYIGQVALFGLKYAVNADWRLAVLIWCGTK